MVLLWIILSVILSCHPLSAEQLPPKLADTASITKISSVGWEEGVWSIADSPIKNCTNTEVTCFDTDDNYIWVGSESGLRVFDRRTNAVVRKYTTADGLPGNRILDVLTIDGSVWVSTWDAVFRIKAGKIDFSSCDVGYGPRFFAHRGDVWVIWNGGAARYMQQPERMPEEFTKAAKAKLGKERLRIICHAFDGDSVWFGANVGLARYDRANDDWRWFFDEPLLNGKEITKIEVTDEDVWFVCQPAEFYRNLEKRKLASRNIDISWDSVVRELSAGSCLLRYDKETSKFTVYTKADGLSGNIVENIVHTRDAIWISTKPICNPDKTFSEGGLDRFDRNGERWHSFKKVGGIEPRWVSLLTLRDGALWTGLVDFDGVLGGTLSIGKGVYAQPFRPAAQRLLLCRYDRTIQDFVLVCKREPIQKLKTVDGEKQSVIDDSERPERLFFMGDKLFLLSTKLPDRRTYGWFPERDGVISEFDRRSGKWRIFGPSTGLGGTTVNEVKKIKDELFCVTDEGLYRFDLQGDECTFFDPSDELAHSNVSAIAVGERYVWVGHGRKSFHQHGGEGISRYDKVLNKWEWFSVKDGLPSGAVITSLAIDGDGKLWVAFGHGPAYAAALPFGISAIARKYGIGVYEDEAWKFYGKKKMRLSDSPLEYSPRKILVDGDRMLVLTDGSGLVMFDGKWHSYTVLTEEQYITDIALSPGRLWYATQKGRLGWYNLKRNRRGKEIHKGNITSIATRGNKLFVATNEKLEELRIKDNIWVVLSEQQFYEKRNIIPWDDETLWFFSGGALYKFDLTTKKALMLNHSSGLLSYHGITSLAKDAQYLWVGGQNGLSRINVDKLHWVP